MLDEWSEAVEQRPEKALLRWHETTVEVLPAGEDEKKHKFVTTLVTYFC
jgi:hypothetical protein